MDNKEFVKQMKIKVFQLARKIIALVKKFPNNHISWVIGDQLVRTGTSIGANYIEAQAASSRKDFTNFIRISLKSGNETKWWLALSKDLDGKLIPEINGIINDTDEIVKIFGQSVLSLKKK
jgi:four helix bundle protein